MHPGPGELWPTSRDHAAHDSNAIATRFFILRLHHARLKRRTSIFYFSLSRQIKSPGMARGAVVAGAAGLCVFLNSLHGELVFDDVHAVERNQDVLGGTSLSQLFLNDFWGEPLASNSSHKSYRPLTTVSDAFPGLVQYR